MGNGLFRNVPKLEVFEFAVSTNERARKVTTDQSEALKQLNRTPLAKSEKTVLVIFLND